MIPVDRWPPPVLQARTLPIAYRGANWVVAQLPPEYRPRLYAPPGGRETTAAALLHATPQGRATGRPAERESGDHAMHRTTTRGRRRTTSPTRNAGSSGYGMYPTRPR